MFSNTRVNMKTTKQKLAQMFARRGWLKESIWSEWFGDNQSRFMTTSKRVQDRSTNKRVQHLEMVTEKCTTFQKVHLLLEVLKKEPEMVIPVRSLEQYRRQINLPKPNRISNFVRKSPKLFELCKDQRGGLWCGLTERAEELVREEERLVGENEDKAAEIVTRLLMMTVDKRLRLDKIAHFRRDFGLPMDFRDDWVNKYPQLFKLSRDGGAQHLELVDWNPRWAVTKLEKRTVGTEASGRSSDPRMLSLGFPMNFPPNHRKVYRDRQKIELFQKMPYLCPYADARGIKPGSLGFDKRAVAVMHEILSFTMEKRLATTDHLTHFRRELTMPQKLMRLLLKHCGIFYVSEKGKRFSVFLTEAYDGSELIEKCPLVLWKEKVQGLIGYRVKRKDTECFSEMSDMEEEDCSDHESLSLQVEDEETKGVLDEDLEMDHGEMDIGDL